MVGTQRKPISILLEHGLQVHAYRPRDPAPTDRGSGLSLADSPGYENGPPGGTKHRATAGAGQAA